MDKYKEKYDQILQEMEEINNKKNNLELLLEEMNKEKIELNIKEDDQNHELQRLKRKRLNILNKNTKIYNIIKNILLVILLIAVILSGVNIVSGITSITKKIFASIGLFVGFGNLYAMSAIVLNLISDYIITKVQNKNKKVPKAIDLAKEINKKNKELIEIQERKNNLIEETDKIQNNIAIQIEQKESKEKELELLKDEIVKVLFKTSSLENNAIEGQVTKPYTRVKKTK